MITEAIATLRRSLNLPVDASKRGPVPLEAFYEGMTAPRLTHVELAGLTRGSVQDYLRSHQIDIEDLGDPAQMLEGFLFSTGTTAWAFVNTLGKTLGRQRFTAVHELGHAVLHRGRMGRYIADEKIFEEADDENPMEREANRFAAELLMPEEVCRARGEELRLTMKCCPRQALAYRLASELLVSVQAMRYLRKEDPFTAVSAPDLIVLDLNLPKKNGREVLADLKADDVLKDIPVILLSTSAIQEDIIQTYGLDRRCCYTKPFRFDDFIKVMQSIEAWYLSITSARSSFPSDKPR